MKARRSKVYFVDMRSTATNSQIARLKKSLHKAGVDSLASKGELLAIKVHFGELGCTSYIRPIYLKTIIDVVTQSGCLAFLTDTNTLYVGTRSNTVEHIKTAVANGFSYASMGIPIIIADGLKGANYEPVRIEGSALGEVKIASDIVNADALLVVSHVKGHELTGLGGALKNLGMGCGSRAGKLEMHSGMEPRITDACTGCSRCVKWCPAGAIKVTRKRARIDSTRCIGCAECIVVCPFGAIKVNWKWDARFVQERMVEYAAGAMKGKRGRIGFVNFVMDISPQCDCYGFSDASIVPDVGILVSKDPVAIDQASADLINQQVGIPETAVTSLRAGSDKLKNIHPDVDWRIQITYAEKLGLGTSHYQLVKLK
ncbi:MAG TPA: DUF362 domain-containing protein [Firmicutes bacterium]|nr:DUF362 domain-containing protein [Bacillota bacterium]